LPYSPQPKRTPTQRFSDDNDDGGNDVGINDTGDGNNGNELRNLASPITVLEETNTTSPITDNVVDITSDVSDKKMSKNHSTSSGHPATYSYISDKDIKTVEKAKSSTFSLTKRKAAPNNAANYNIALKAFDIAESSGNNTNNSKKTGRWK
jgi:hypothetical protein